MAGLETKTCTVAELARQSDRNVADILAMCDAMGVDASDGDTLLTALGTAVLRGVISGDIDPAQRAELRVRSDSVIADESTPAPERQVRRPAPVTVTDESIGRRRVPDGQIDRYVPRWLRAVGVLSIVFVVFFVWRALSGDEADEEATQVLFSAAPDLAMGDCFNADPGLWLDTAVAVSCTASHDAQAAAVALIGPEGRSYPELDTLRSESIGLCRQEMRGVLDPAGEEVVGVSVPTAAQWAAGEQRALCVIVSGNGDKLVGSAL